MAAVRAVKAAAAEAGMDSGNIAFTTSTPVNLEWKMKALIREVRKEHSLFRKAPEDTGERGFGPAGAPAPPA
jgi:hypothetical protein